MLGACALLLAWSLDAAFGEPRSAWHPVAWFGRLVAPLGRGLQWLAPQPAGLVFGAGAAAWLLAVGAVAAAGWAVQGWLLEGPAWAAVAGLALALKPSFAWRMLRDEVQAVESALGEGLETGRRRLAGLCSRDVTALDAAGVREAAIETLAENLNDSLVAPLFWFLLAGLPGAWAWRAANTLDAMWGHRGRWEWAGKWAARADDVLAWVPARCTAALLWRPGVAGAALWREARRTPSPNGGWPMAAMALRLGLRLGKSGTYVLHAAGRVPDGHDVGRALQSATTAARAAFVVAALVLAAAALPAGGMPW